MNDFDLRKYLAEGRLLKENMQDEDLLASQAIDILDEIRVYAEDEELIQYLNKSMDYLERIPSNDDVYSAIQAVADGLSPYTGEAFDYEVDDMQSELERLIAENKVLKEEKRSVVDYDNRDGRTTELFLDNGDSVEVDVIELYNEIRKNNEDLAENKLIKETKEEDYYNLLMDLKGTELDWITKRRFETLMMKRGMYDSFEDFLDDEIDFFQEEGNVEIIDKIKSTFLNENNLLKEYLDLEIDEDQVTINSYSGEYSGFIEDDNTVDFSVTGYEEERENDAFDFDEDNWKDILGPKHAFVKISNQIPTTKVEAAGDYVMITVDLEDLKAIAD